jgi:ribosome small subunit-dependent GTPase A
VRREGLCRPPPHSSFRTRPPAEAPCRWLRAGRRPSRRGRCIRLPARAHAPADHLALLATSANRDLNPRRLARFLTITARGGVRAVVLLTKSDLVDEPAELAAAVEARLDGTPVLPVSVPRGTGLDEVRALLEPRRTAVLLGTSGVGKSTLLNALLGEERQLTREIRASDDRGRHATVRRELVPLPGGALLVDTPGLRLVAPLEDRDDEVPLLDKAQLKRERRARERAFHRAHYRELRDRRRERDERTSWA